MEGLAPSYHWSWVISIPGLLALMLMMTALMIVVMLLKLWLMKGQTFYGLVDHPGAHRLHQNPTPLLGGIAVVLSLLICLGLARLWSAINGVEFALFPLGVLFALIMLLAVGVWDDARQISVRIRFAAQGLAAVALLLSGVVITDMGVIDLGADWGWLSLGMFLGVGVTLFAIIGCINAFNLIDGMDGLAAGLGTVTLTGLAWVVLETRDAAGLMLVLTQLGALCGFLLLNARIGRPRALVFLGDAGSTTLGLLLAYWVIALSQSPVAAMPATAALWLLGIPIIDTLRVMFERMASGRSPFHPGHEHLHHLLLSTGIGVNSTLVTLLVMQGGMVMMGVWHASGHASPMVMVILWGLLVPASMILAWALRRLSRVSVSGRKARPITAEGR
ncbi:hypothetical protein CKO35_09745 [Ectothiorhodospira shaposhnikovii]|uniref:MraY family glycosyltransferase n=1 Tax=Ectothiorhodospira shaposhnikovii TaxID=1054 RepID=UPI001907391E|nr:MraY family glycosyltransferase [Ectothiorhodospira shaposhnikovii]MBK1673584.1 hypothetical protein [Ectothiorhodospira shaposhnikovii]